MHTRTLSASDKVFLDLPRRESKIIDTSRSGEHVKVSIPETRTNHCFIPNCQMSDLSLRKRSGPQQRYESYFSSSFFLKKIPLGTEAGINVNQLSSL